MGKLSSLTGGGMDPGGTIFSQIVGELPKRQFRRLVARYEARRRSDAFGYWDQFLCMMFAQLTFREGLRDIESCLRAFGDKLYHVGIRANVSRSALARANEVHDWRVFQDFAIHLIGIARSLYSKEPFGIELESAVYAFDSTTIDLCLALFPWARFMDHPLKKGCDKASYAT